MSKILRPISAVLAGFFLGSAVNMGLVMLSSSVIPLPEGVDPANMESLKAGMHLFGPQHFIMPFLAHALGTLVGAYVAASIATKHKKRFAMSIALFFMLGGIVNAAMLPAPLWFEAVDIVLAYIPMGLLGYKYAKK